MTMLALAVVLAVAPPAQLTSAIESKISIPSAKVKIINSKRPNCHGEFEVGPVTGSGRVAIRVRGPACDAWSWATIVVRAPIAVAQQDIATDTPVAPFISVKDSEIHQGADVVTAIPDGAFATRNISKGSPIRATMLRYGPKPGSPLLVRIQNGGLLLENQGVAVSCSPGNVCATLPNGKRVKGHLENGVLIVMLNNDVHSNRGSQ